MVNVYFCYNAKDSVPMDKFVEMDNVLIPASSQPVPLILFVSLDNAQMLVLSLNVELDISAKMEVV